MLSGISALNPEPSPESLQHGGLYIFARGVDSAKIDKTQLICSPSYLRLGAWSIVLGGLDHQTLWRLDWVYHGPLFMDRTCLLLAPVETEVDLQMQQTNKVCSYSTRNEQVETSVCPGNFDGSTANATLFSSRKILLFWKVLNWLRAIFILIKAHSFASCYI